MFYSTRTELASHTLWQTLKFDEMDFLCLFWASFLGTFFLWVHLGWTYLNQCHVALRNCVTVRLFEALLLHGENQVKFFSREKKNAVSEQKPRCKIFLITSSYCCRTSENEPHMKGLHPDTRIPVILPEVSCTEGYPLKQLSLDIWLCKRQKRGWKKPQLQS